MVLSVLLALWLVAVYARVWRLAPANGTDDTAACGDSWDRPCRQLPSVVASALEGDVLELAAGGGYDCGVVIQRSLVLRAVGDGRAVFDCDGRERALWFQNVTVFVSVSGVEVRNGWANASAASPYDSGGGVLVELSRDSSSTSVSFVNCDFRDSSSWSGGGVQVYYGGASTVSSVSFATCTWTNNAAAGAGGGVAVTYAHGTSNASSVSFATCTWTNNTAAGAGGGVAVAYAYGVTSSASSVSFGRCTWTNNTAAGAGGGVIVYYGGTSNACSVSFGTCTLTNNTAMGEGGGVDVYYRGTSTASAVSFATCSWTNNTAARQGGGVTVAYGGTATASSVSFGTCTWTDNTAAGDGGGVEVYYGGTSTASSVSFATCTWTNNTAAGAGGGVNVYYGGTATASSVSIATCTWTNNTAAGDSGGGAASLFLPDSLVPSSLLDAPGCCKRKNWTFPVAVSVDHSALSNNRCTSLSCQGGAMFVLGGGSLRFFNVTFVANSASLLGGALAATGTVAFHASSAALRDNRATQGGAVYVDTRADVSVSQAAVELQAATSDWWVSRAQQLTLTHSVRWSCPPGATLNFTFVKPWADYQERTSVGALLRSTQRLSCFACSHGTYSLGVAYLDGNSSTPQHQIRCLNCPYGADCSLGGAEVRGLPGFFGLNDSNTTVRFTACPPSYCRTDVHPWDDSCAGHRTGRLCGECLVGYSQAVGSSACGPDAHCQGLGWMLPVGLLVGACWLGLSLAQASAVRSGTLMATVYFVNGAAVLLPRPVLSPLVGLFRLRVEGSGDSAALCPFPGLTTLGSLFWGYLSPTLLLALAGALRLAVGATGQAVSSTRWARAVTELGLFLYSSFSQTTFDLLHCVPIDGLSGMYLFRAATVQCYTSWQSALFLVLVGVSLVPPFLFWMTWRGRGHSTVYTFLTSPFRRERRWWGSVLLGQLWLLNLLAVFVSDPSHRALALTVVALACLLLHVLGQPFASTETSALQTLCTICWVMIAVLSLPGATLNTVAVADSPLTPSVDAWYQVFLLLPVAAAVLLWLVTLRLSLATTEPTAVTPADYVELGDERVGRCDAQVEND